MRLGPQPRNLFTSIGIRSLFFLLFSIVLACPLDCLAQYDSKSDPKTNRQRGIYLLKEIRTLLKQKYYDPNFRGLDLDTRFKAAEEQIKSQEKNWQIYRTIAQVLADLNDSHTTFLPPDRLFRVEYGFSTMMIGSKCFVVDVVRGTDAAAQGLRAGDEITAIGGITPSRENYRTINYIIYGLDPQETLPLRLADVDGKQRELTVRSKFISPEQRKTERKGRKDDEQSKPYSCKEISADLIVCKLRTFEVDKGPIDKMMKQVGAHKKLVLDLRGNGGGFDDTLLYLLGYFFEKDVLVGSDKMRNKTRERTANGRGGSAFTGDLGVLIDGDSASASEIFARTIQLQKRGTIYGDTSAGAVMGAYAYGIAIPLTQAKVANETMATPYYTALVEVTVSDFLMSDGSRLEGKGVAPDIPIGPSPLALSQRADPVLAYAVGLLGTQISAEAAGELHFLVPKSEEQSFDEDDTPQNN